MLKCIICSLLLAAGCSFGPGNIQSRHSSDLGQRKIKRIAVLPPEITTVEAKKTLLGPPASQETRSSEREAPELLARLVYSAMAPISNWQIVSESEVREVAQSIPRTTDAERVKRVGEMVYADAVIIGRVQRYRERVGEEWGAKSPASVAFVLDLVDVRRGDIVWSARFDETQKSLSENIFALGDITQRGVRWLSAEQLMAEGVKKAVSQLHQALFRSST
jgi:TolB-like protein